MNTQVAIIGGGPSGLLLSQVLMQAGIDTIVIERRSRQHVLSRIRAGVVEQGTADLIEAAGAGARMREEGQVHRGVHLCANEQHVHIDFDALCGRAVLVYGQTEITRDLYAAQDGLGATILHGVEDVAIADLDTGRPRVTFTHDGTQKAIACDYVAGCDGFHGVCRATIPAGVRREFEKVYPFGWLGILSQTPPVNDELIYAKSERGFALSSMRGPNLSRAYIQVPLSDTVADWPDDAFWSEFRARLPERFRDDLITGPSIEKSIAPLRSFVSEPMQWGRLFLCGDAAHIVPPTGAKGLNLAASDVFYLSRALIALYRDKEGSLIARYGRDALARVWQAMRFSWAMTLLLHRLPGESEFDVRIKDAEFAALEHSETARRNLAENYTGLPF